MEIILATSCSLLVWILTRKLCTWLGGDWLLVEVGQWMLDRWCKFGAKFLGKENSDGE